MAPQPKASSESLKQKSLKSFFSKGPAKEAAKSTHNSTKTNAIEKAAPSNSVPTASKRKNIPSSSPEPKTPDSKYPNARYLSSPPAASPASSLGMTTPPTSDVIDVDMYSQEEEEPRSIKPVRIECL